LTQSVQPGTGKSKTKNALLSSVVWTDKPVAIKRAQLVNIGVGPVNIWTAATPQVTY